MAVVGGKFNVRWDGDHWCGHGFLRWDILPRSSANNPLKVSGNLRTAALFTKIRRPYL
jgi:hypothetical protein